MNRTIKIILLLPSLIMAASCLSRGSASAYLEHENAGTAAYVKGDYAEAEKQYKAGLAEAEKNGRDNYLVVYALHYLGQNYMAQKKDADAESAFLRELAVAEKLYGTSHPDILQALDDLTILYIGQRRFDEAEKYNQRELAILSKEPDEKYKNSKYVAEFYRKVIAEGKGANPK